MNPTIDLLYRMADDVLILGHRNSEWTGLGPVLEEDIAFSSMAQDKIGHAYALYKILHEKFGEAEPDHLAFNREEKLFKCCHLVQLPNREYDLSLMRHFLFDHAEYLRYLNLKESRFSPLAKLAVKIKGELKYHVLHGDTWVKKLGKANESSNARMQNALNELFPYALGIFEPGIDEQTLINDQVFVGEEALKAQWLEKIEAVLNAADLNLPETTEAQYGGRKGKHTEHLAPMLEEMTEVFRIDPSAEW
ncbi:MAG: 1,2-phenylacetyl-CoA epoxidase subunit PaaC [Chitinophagales bacterium]